MRPTHARLGLSGLATKLYNQVNETFKIAETIALKNDFIGISKFLNEHIQVCTKKIEKITQLIHEANAR